MCCISVLQGLPVLFRAVGQLFGIQTGILDAAGHAGRVGQQGVGVLLDEGPGVCKAVLLIGGEAVVPLGIGVFDDIGGLHGQIAVLSPAQQGIRRDDRLQRAARNAGAPAQAGRKGILRGGRGEDGVVALIQIRGQLAGVGLRHRPKDFTKKIFTILRSYFPDITKGEVKEATDAAYAEYAHHMSLIRKEGERIIDQARAEGRRIIVLAGRPYHVDPEVNHGIDTLITRAGAAVITEDSISNRVEKFPTTVLNQWTYHARLYAAARYCCTQRDMDLVQLVSFGCGVDAITSDETREILQAGGKLYTQLKIDEITNLGAVRIRLRSLFAALDEQDEARETARKEA